MMKLLSLTVIAASAGVLCSMNATAADWDYPAEQFHIENAAQALDYLNAQYGDQGHYRFRYRTDSLLGHHYNFDVLLDGNYQAQQAVVLSTNNDNVVTRIFLSLANTIVRNGDPLIAAELENPRTLQAQRPPAVANGQLVDAQVAVFEPDLRTMQRQPAPDTPWQSLAEYPQPYQYLLRPAALLQADGRYYLANQQLRQVDAEALVSPAANGQPASSDNSDIVTAGAVTSFSSIAELANLTVDDPRFAQVMAFYHLNASLDYVSSLGFSLFNQPLEFDARGLASNNSAFYKGPNAALFGVGGPSPDALDADVIIHELGHGLSYAIVPDWGYGHTGAIGEGFGDYWAGSYSYRVQYQDAARRHDEFELATVFNWDGYFGTSIATRSLANLQAKYYETAEYQPHISVGGTLGDELWSTPLFQALQTAVTTYGDVAFDEFNRIVLEGMYGTGRGMKMHDLAESTLYAAAQLYPDKDYRTILESNFRRHGLLKPAFTAEYAARYLAADSPIEVSLQPTGRQAAINGSWQVGSQSQALNNAAFSELTLSQVLPTDGQCGVALTASFDLNYRYAERLQSQPWQHTTTLIVGTPALAHAAKMENSTIPDARQLNNGQLVSGTKVYTITLTDADKRVDNQFAVYLDISHSQPQDLRVTLTSPSGTKVTLFDHALSTRQAIKDYFTFAHDPQLAALANEPTQGLWMLEITDSSAGDTGTLNQWGVSHFDNYDCGTPAVEPPPTTPEPPATPEPAASSSSGGATSPASLLWLLLPLLWRWTTREQRGL
ncbi:proprotein convertase P-domain-containing protein [Shewanella sp. C32]|uniref:Proprotein convertase P-domain-containing protein n=1 Tax=Shewanella electrica TaxID=515560 RepID=A0ABT2FIG1_9GAMM|nr:proprotein convertase P-domain-containing protein [Shewanella electrica]MCH1924188.1 proprotein convertase P-domain-containing protein [Shewanella electrica]MCS4556091.1 proprotein convertase P-domain-containing protein [Shewanella electrica]